jgi:hypothetical protein
LGVATAEAGGLDAADDGADLGVPVRMDNAGIGADLTVTFFRILKSAFFVWNVLHRKKEKRKKKKKSESSETNEGRKKEGGEEKTQWTNDETNRTREFMSSIPLFNKILPFFCTPSKATSTTMF